MAEEQPRYSFHPLEQRGVLLGFQAGQVAMIGGGMLAAWLVERIAGSALALLVLAGFAGLALWTPGGMTAASWLALAGRWAARRSRGPAVSFEPLEGTTLSKAGLQRCGVVVPVGPTSPAGLEVGELESQPGEGPVGVVVDRRSRQWAAVLAVQGGSFCLLDPHEQAGRLDGWRIILSSLARPGTPLRRVQWVQRSAPGDSSSLLGASAALPEALPGPPGAVKSYLDLLASAGPASRIQGTWLVIAVAGPARQDGSRGRYAAETLRRELRLLEGQLRNAGIRSPAPLDARGIAAVLHAAYQGEVPSRADRSPRGVRAAEEVGAPRGVWPLAEEDGWAAYRAEAFWHATYWIAEWPRIEVGPDFMMPLLVGTGRRAVSITMAPVSPERALREARSARTADLADEQLRSRVGFMPSARRGREAEGAERRETELADGHAEYRFSGYVTVSAGDRKELATACAEAEHAAQAAHLELRLLYGRQREAFTWTMPSGRGLR